MEEKPLGNDGLRHLWGKLKIMLNGKAGKTHTHPIPDAATGKSYKIGVDNGKVYIEEL